MLLTLSSTKLIIIAALIISVTHAGCRNGATHNDMIIGSGQMPNLAKDDKNNLHLVYGSGDSILYTYSTNEGKDFTLPVVVAVLPRLAASHMRGPQIAVTSLGLSMIACNSFGDIFSYSKDGQNNWKKGSKVNDADTVAKEGLMALAADARNVVAVWLDLRGNKHNKIFGSRSNDGGRTWSKNFLIYSSPDGTVCECCKPSVVMKGDNVYVMFRNWLDGNRDLYLIHSADGGSTFGQAQKLGEGSWKLDGCPMDGGGLILNKIGNPETVWKREDNIYTCRPGEPEKKIGEGRNCTIENANGKTVYAWTSNGEVFIMKPGGEKRKVGEGSLPIIKATSDKQLICVWENDRKIHSTTVAL